MMDQIWIPFVFIGFPISFALWIWQHGKIKLPVRAALALGIAVIVVGSAWLMAGPETRGTSAWYESTPGLQIVLFLLMIVGMASRYITKAIELRKERIAEFRKSGAPFVKPNLEFDVWEFSYPMFLSVVTYGALLAQIKEPTLTLSNCVLSYQTGFFWQTIAADKISGKR